MAERLTEQMINEIRARCEAATPGKWFWENDLLLTDNETYLILKPYYHDDTGEINTCITRKNAEFIAHARQDIPAMLDYISELQSENAKLREKGIFPPCKVGDWLYYIQYGIVHKAKIEEIMYGETKYKNSKDMKIFAWNYKTKEQITYCPYTGDHWTDSSENFVPVFLTRKEAQTALEGGGGEL